MKAKTKYEEQIMREIQGMPVPLQKMIAKMVRVLREEMSASAVEEKKATDEFLLACGTWKDSRTVEKQIDDIYNSRKSRSAMGTLS